jgi:hypothetical protein
LLPGWLVEDLCEEEGPAAASGAFLVVAWRRLLVGPALGSGMPTTVRHWFERRNPTEISF